MRIRDIIMYIAMRIYEYIHTMDNVCPLIRTSCYGSKFRLHDTSYCNPHKCILCSVQYGSLCLARFLGRVNVPGRYVSFSQSLSGLSLLSFGLAFVLSRIGDSPSRDAITIFCRPITRSWRTKRRNVGVL